jgi:heme exporter protein C
MNKLLDNMLPIATLAGIIMALYGALVMAPTERVMGDVQRIFYFHLGSAVAAFTAFTVVLVASVVFLVMKSPAADAFSKAAAEAGILFTTMVLVTGPMWARPVWGKWWVWDPRLTTTLILWFLYVGYLVLRGAMPGYRGQVAAAVYAILAYVDVPIVYFSVRWWRGIHPVVIKSEGGGLAPDMLPPLFIAMAAFIILLVTILRERVLTELLSGRVEELEKLMEDQAL